MKKILYLIPILAAVFACTKVDEKIQAADLGVKNSEILLGPDEGTFEIEVLSNGEFQAVVAEDCQWLAFQDGQKSCKGSGDQLIALAIQNNKGTIRTTTVSIYREGKKVDVKVSQEGVINAGLEFESRATVAPAEGGVSAVRLFTMLKDNEISYEVKYEDVTGWISGIVKENNLLKFNVAANESSEERYATIVARSGKMLSSLAVVQASEAGFTQASMAQVKALGDGVITDALVFTGIVINDNSEGNGAENLNISHTIKDVHGAEKTIYVQTEDGSEGIRVDFVGVQDNIARRYDKVSLLARGLTLEKFNSPERYVLSGATAHNLLTAEAGDQTALVNKTLSISELTDSDIYTYVTLKDCEFPVRKGPFVPVDLRYTQVMNKYPMPVRDIDGNSTFLMTNIGAAWERDGEGVPQGRGSISGVIVHEKCDNFEWDNEVADQLLAEGIKMDYITGTGTISRYQIRPIAKSEIQVSKDWSDSFSDMLLEVSYVNKSYNQIARNMGTDNIIHSNYPLVPFPTENSAVLYRLQNGKTVVGFSNYRDWTHLGPLKDGVITNPEGSNGVYDYFGNSDHFYLDSGVGSKGLIDQQNGSGWYCSSWDGSVDQCWVAEFSTEGLDESNFPLSLTLGAINGYGEYNTFGAPRYWKAEYSLNRSTWTTFGEYTVPDFPIVYNRKAWQCPGYKYVSINLPENSALLGRNKVYVRILPANTIAATEESYDSGSAVKAAHSALNYFAIRYNK